MSAGVRLGGGVVVLTGCACRASVGTGVAGGVGETVGAGETTASLASRKAQPQENMTNKIEYNKRGIGMAA